MLRGTLGILVLCGSVFGQTIPNTRVTSCTDGGCHAPIMDHKVLHGPTGLSSCESCHSYDDPTQHTFVMKREGVELCAFCHIGAGAPTDPFGHKPFVEGRCGDCHDPHGAGNKMLLRMDSQSELCGECHKDVIVGSNVHSPAADGECLACHGAHGAEHRKLLTRTGSALCFTCHDDTRQLIQSAVHVHQPVAEDCLDCHNPHASDHAAHLSQEALPLCESCHPGPPETARTAAYPHDAVIEGKACLNCHSPHASNHEGMLHSHPIEACLVCHTDPIHTHSGREIAGVPEIAAPGAVLHGPVQKELCTGCHELHGSEHANLLAANYTSNFYESFDLKHYELCFECHSSQLVLNADSTVETNFRNGTQNLHYTHVHMEKNGRACRSCHATHASGNEVHIVDAVPYGQWEIPLTYTRTATGGACAAACHHEATYDRVHPTVGIEVPEEYPGEGQ